MVRGGPVAAVRLGDPRYPLIGSSGGYGSSLRTLRGFAVAGRRCGSRANSSVEDDSAASQRSRIEPVEHAPTGMQGPARPAASPTLTPIDIRRAGGYDYDTPFPAWRRVRWEAAPSRGGIGTRVTPTRSASPVDRRARGGAAASPVGAAPAQGLRAAGRRRSGSLTAQRPAAACVLGPARPAGPAFLCGRQPVAARLGGACGCEPALDCLAHPTVRAPHREHRAVRASAVGRRARRPARGDGAGAAARRRLCRAGGDQPGSDRPGRRSPARLVRRLGARGARALPPAVHARARVPGGPPDRPGTLRRGRRRRPCGDRHRSAARKRAPVADRGPPRGGQRQRRAARVSPLPEAAADRARARTVRADRGPDQRGGSAMIDVLEGVLVRLLTSRVPNLTAAQIGFNAPDATWRGLIPHAAGNMLNVSLVELAENLELRSNERIRSATGAGIESRRAPARLDCRFLMSAWSPVSAHPLTD